MTWGFAAGGRLFGTLNDPDTQLTEVAELVTRHPIESVEEIEKRVVGEVSERLRGPAGSTTSCTFRSCRGLTR